MFDKISIVDKPWKYGVAQDFIGKELINDLKNQFFDLDEHFSQRIAGTDKKYSCSQMMIYSELDSPCQKIYPLDHISAWKKLVCLINDPDYQNSIYKNLNIDCSNLKKEIILNEYKSGDFISAHTDRKPKILTHLIYLSDLSEADKGGELEIIDQSGKVDHFITPKEGKDIFLIRSDNSWHAVSKITAEKVRRSIQIVFWEDTPINTSMNRIQSKRCSK